MTLQTSEISPELQAFGSAIRIIRERQHMSRTKFCDCTGIGRSVLPQVEEGLRGITVRTLRVVLEVSGMTWREFGELMETVDPLGQ